MKQRWLSWWIAVILLASCTSASPTSVPLSTATPSGERPTRTPRPQSITPTAAQPTATPMTNLPAPVYLIQSDQVMRLAPNGHQLTQITYELQPVRELSVANNGTLVYVAENDLIALDGAGRRVVIGAQTISRPRISPDGQRVVYRLDDPTSDLLGTNAPSGIYISELRGGRPRLLQADDPKPVTPDFSNPAWRYIPVSWSPDGQRLLLYAVMQPEIGIPGGEVVIIGPGDRVVRAFSCCEEEIWSVNGDELTVAGGGPGPDLRFGLYRIDVEHGTESPVVASSETIIPLVRAPQRMANGDIYAFIELVPVQAYQWDYPFRPQMVRVGNDGIITPIRPERLGEPLLVLWDPQARGALVQFAEQANLIWVPTDPTLPVVTTVANGVAAAWTPTADLSIRPCDGFTTISPQPANHRQFDPAVADLQGRLAALGFDPGPIDGLFGPTTATAVQAFRIAAGLPAGDSIDCVAWQSLLTRSTAQ